jgi:hypothetical protein
VTNDTLSIFRAREWDRSAIHAYFRVKAANAEAYLIELRGKLSTRPAYEGIYDETLASFYVHNYFHGRTWLASRTEFLRALAELETATIPSDDYFDRARFATFRLNHIRSLMEAATPRP